MRNAAFGEPAWMSLVERPGRSDGRTNRRHWLMLAHSMSSCSQPSGRDAMVQRPLTTVSSKGGVLEVSAGGVGEVVADGAAGAGCTPRANPPLRYCTSSRVV